MWERGGKAALALGAVALTIVAMAPPAGAKVLPIASVSVSTARPTVDKAFTVTVRFQTGKDFVDAEWEDAEIFLLPAARVDAQGWPRSPDDRGKAIPIRRVGFGVFRGTAVVRTPGDYVVLDASGIAARSDASQGIVVNGTYASPVRVRVVPASSASSWPPVALVVGSALAALILLARRRRRPAAAPREPEAVVYAGR